MKVKKYKKDTFYLCSLIFLESILLKIFQYTFLPDKYFYDSNNILSIIEYDKIADKAYSFTANFFKTINIFHFDSLLEWSVFLAIIFSIISFFMLLKHEKYTLIQYIFIYSSIALLNIYVFNISKDIIQFIIFLILFFILNSKLNNNKKLLLITLILTLEALFFRIYYLIMALIILDVYFIYILFSTGKVKNKKNKWKIVLLTIIAFFAQIYIVQMISNDNYNSIINARLSVNIYREDSLDAVTIINDLLGQNTNFLIFIGNYIINLFRLLFPVELLLKGIKYIPFIIYQIYISLNLFKACKNMTNKSILWITTLIGFIMVSAIFEPDFGSFIRHESAIFLLLLELTILNKNQRKERKKI